MSVFVSLLSAESAKSQTPCKAAAFFQDLAAPRKTELAAPATFPLSDQPPNIVVAPMAHNYQRQQEYYPHDQFDAHQRRGYDHPQDQFGYERQQYGSPRESEYALSRYDPIGVHQNDRGRSLSIETEYFGFELRPPKAKKGEKLSWSDPAVVRLPFSSRDFEKEAKQHRQSSPVAKTFDSLGWSQQVAINRLVDGLRDDEHYAHAEWSLEDIRPTIVRNGFTSSFVRRVRVIVKRSDKSASRSNGLALLGTRKPRSIHDRDRRDEGHWGNHEYDPPQPSARPNYRPQYQANAVEPQGLWPSSDHHAAYTTPSPQYPQEHDYQADHYPNDHDNDAYQHTQGQHDQRAYRQDQHRRDLSRDGYQHSLTEDAHHGTRHGNTARVSSRGQSRYPQRYHRSSRLPTFEQSVQDLYLDSEFRAGYAHRPTYAGRYYSDESRSSIEPDSIFSHSDARSFQTPLSSPSDSTFWPAKDLHGRYNDDYSFSDRDGWRGEVERRSDRRRRRRLPGDHDPSPLIVKRRHSNWSRSHDVEPDYYSGGEGHPRGRSRFDARRDYAEA